LNLKDYILSKKREARVSEMRVTIEKRWLFIDVSVVVL
jgi:hypothetical protein